MGITGIVSEHGFVVEICRESYPYKGWYWFDGVSVSESFGTERDCVKDAYSKAAH